MGRGKSRSTGIDANRNISRIETPPPSEGEVVENYLEDPWVGVCYIEIQPVGHDYVTKYGTAFFVTPTVALTAGHNGYDPAPLASGGFKHAGNSKGLADKVFMHFGWNGSEALAIHSTRNILVHPKYLAGNINRDVALLQFDEPIGSQVGTFGVEAMEDAELTSPGSRWEVAGYARRRLTRYQGSIVGTAAEAFKHDGITSVGVSGGPVFRIDNDGLGEAVGLHARWEAHPLDSIRFDQPLVDWISDQISSA